MAGSKTFLQPILNETVSGIDTSIQSMNSTLNNVKTSVDQVPDKIDDQIEQLEDVVDELQNVAELIGATSQELNITSSNPDKTQTLLNTETISTSTTGQTILTVTCMCSGTVNVTAELMGSYSNLNVTIEFNITGSTGLTLSRKGTSYGTVNGVLTVEKGDIVTVNLKIATSGYAGYCDLVKFDWANYNPTTSDPFVLN